MSAKITNARRQALIHLRNFGFKPNNCPSNKIIVTALKSYGVIISCPGNAGTKLCFWYDNLPKNERIVTPRKNKTSQRAKITKPTRKKVNPVRKNDWNALRYQAFLIHGRKCQCCGDKPPNCVLHVDHIKPKSLYPELEWSLDNLQILCESCNIGKSNRDDTDFRTEKIDPAWEKNFDKYLN